MHKRTSARYWPDWAAFVLTHGLLNWYVLESGEAILKTQVPASSLNLWHGMFVCLCNSFYLPLHHWVFLLSILYRELQALHQPEAVARFENRTVWGNVLLHSAVTSAAVLSAGSFVLTWFWSFLRYGPAGSFSWGRYAPSSLRLGAVLAISCFARLLVSFAVSVFFLYVFLRVRKKAAAFGGTLLVLFAADFILLQTTIFVSFKPLVPTASFSFAYFERDALAENLLLSYLSSALLFGVFTVLCKKECRTCR